VAHPSQKDFFNNVKAKYPSNFTSVSVLDCGSLDINGSLKDLFSNSTYTGVDIVAGKNVDVVSKISDLSFNMQFDTLVSGEMLEHDETWRESLLTMYNLVKHGGLIAISCAGKDRPEHGTKKSDGNEWGTGDYYQNLEPSHLKTIYQDKMFKTSHYEVNIPQHDTYFYGIKA